MKWTFGLMLAAGLAAGCAHSRRGDYTSGLSAGFSQVRPPAFLAGPMGVLLTNAHGFSAHAALADGNTANTGEAVSGDLLVCGNKLLFAQATDPAVPKRFRAGAITFIWDVAHNQGYVLSEALQGYAPLSFSMRPTNLVVSAASSVPQKIGGYRCGQEAATVSSNDGTATVLHVWRALDLNGLPVQIRTATNAVPLVLSLSRLRLEEPAAELFRPPDGFTRYETAEGMMSELNIRQQNLKRRVTGVSGQSELLNGPDARGYR